MHVWLQSLWLYFLPTSRAEPHMHIQYQYILLLTEDKMHKENEQEDQLLIPYSAQYDDSYAMYDEFNCIFCVSLLGFTILWMLQQKSEHENRINWELFIEWKNKNENKKTTRMRNGKLSAREGVVLTINFISICMEFTSICDFWKK